MNGPTSGGIDEGLGPDAHGPQTRPLAGRLALVTGAARRIGQATALQVAASGADVIVHHRTSSKEAEATAHRIRGLGQEAWTLQADLGVEAEVQNLLEAATDLGGQPPSLLVNNASTFPQDGLDDLTLDTFLDTLQVNAWAPLALSRALATTVDEGATVNLLDARIGHANRDRTAYALSKDLLASITRHLAAALAPTVRVNAVAPGPILPSSSGEAGEFEAIAQATPLQRPGDPEDIANAVVHLLAAPYTTGAVLPVSGGQHLLAGASHG